MSKDWQLVKHALSGDFFEHFKKLEFLYGFLVLKPLHIQIPLRTCQVNRHYISNTFFVKSSGHFSEAEICVFFAGGAEAKVQTLKFHRCRPISGWEFLPS